MNRVLKATAGAVFCIFLICGTVFAQAPNVVSVAPGQNELNVAADASISVTFDTDMAAETINENTFVVTTSLTGKCEGTYSYDPGTYTAAFDPVIDFLAGDIVSISLTGGIQSGGEVALAQSFRWSFTVVVASSAGPCFDSTHSYTPANPGDMFVADFDNDNDPDLLLIDDGESYYTISLNNGDGTFTDGPLFDFVAYSRGIELADFDLDGDIDFAVATTITNLLTVFSNDGTGQFSASGSHSIYVNSRDMARGDFNGDGYPDLAIGHEYRDSISVNINDGSGGFSLDYSLYDIGQSYSDLCTSDIDNDGDVDIGVTSAGYMAVLLNNGDGTFADPVNFAVSGVQDPIIPYDFDADGDIDFSFSASSYNIVLMENLGFATAMFDTLQKVDIGGKLNQLYAGDLDGDYDLDLVGDRGLLMFFINGGNGNITEQYYLEVNVSNGRMAVADFDGDGRLDIAADASKYDDNITFFQNSQDTNCEPWQACCFEPGDANYDGSVNILDITYNINYLYKDGPEPPCKPQADSDGGGRLNILDVTRLISYLYTGGLWPVCGPEPWTGF